LLEGAGEGSERRKRLWDQDFGGRGSGALSARRRAITRGTAHETVVERLEERVELLRLFFGSLDCSELPLNLLHRVTRQALGPLGWVERFLRAQLRIEAGEPAL
jgi:hypothetical protein